MQERIKQARDHMAGLLSIKRFCALVVAIKHEVTVKGAKRDRTQKVPTGAYHVRLFEGGRIELPLLVGSSLAAAVDAKLSTLTREALQPYRDALVKVARMPPGIESLRSLEEGLRHLEAANVFGVEWYESGLIIQPRFSMDAYVYFDGTGAKERAEAFCVLVNEVLTSAFVKREAELTQALAEAVGGL